jgi:hypothetical protein
MPVAGKHLAETFERVRWSWRLVTKGHAAVAYVRVSPAHRWQHGRAAVDVADPVAEARWLLVERRTDRFFPNRLSNLPAETPLVHAVELWKSR